MKKIGNFLSEACSYTILMLCAVFLFAEVIGIDGTGISFVTFIVVLGYALLIATANVLKARISANKTVKLLMHYTLTLAGFIFLFSFLGNMENGAPTKIFVAIALFTVLYAAIFVLVWLIAKYVIKSEDTAPTPHEEKPQSTYTSLYGDKK